MKESWAAILQPDRQDSTPLYLQIAERLRAVIGEGRIRPNQALPPERELASLLGVSRVTIRKAFELLAGDRVLSQRAGAGTFVTEHQPAPAARIEQKLFSLTSFSDEMRARGFEPGSVWLHRALERASAEEAMALGISPGTPVVRLERIRTANGDPVAIERAAVAASDLPSPELVRGSLYESLGERGLGAVRALQRLRAALASPREAELLNLVLPAPVLRMERRSFLADGRAIEVTFSSCRADFYDFVSELRS